jgi:hypothetical protein
VKLMGKQSRRPNRRHRIPRRDRPPTWFDLSTGARVEFANHIVGHIRDTLAPRRAPHLNLALQPASQWHVDRLCHAFVDVDRADDEYHREFDMVDEAYFDHLHRVDADEAERMQLGFAEFTMVVMNMPAGATCPADWFRHVVSHGLDFTGFDDDDEEHR